jgi:hypothetical protein
MERRRTIMTTNIPSNTPLQQQIDEFIAEGASWLPTGLLWDLLRPIGQLITSIGAGSSLDFSIAIAAASTRLTHI